MSKQLKLGIGNAVKPETKVFHGSVMSRDSFGRTTDLVSAWLTKEHALSQKVSGDLRVLIQGMLEFCYPKAGSGIGHLEVASEGEQIYVSIRFENTIINEGEDIEKKLTQYWVNSEEGGLVKKILYPHDRVEVRFLQSLNLVEWRIIRVVGLEMVNMDIPTFSIFTDTAATLETDHENFVEMGDLPYEEWLSTIYQKSSEKSKSGEFFHQGSPVLDHSEWSREVNNNSHSSEENVDIVFSENTVETAENSTQTFKKNSKIEQDETETVFNSENDQDEVNHQQKIKSSSKIEQDDTEVTFSSRDLESEEKLPHKVKSKPTQSNEEAFSEDSKTENLAVHFDAKEKKEKPKKPSEIENADLGFQVDPSSLLGGVEEITYDTSSAEKADDQEEIVISGSELEVDDQQTTIKNTTESVLNNEEVIVNPVMGSQLEVAALKEKVLQYEKLLKRKELQGQKSSSEIQALRRRIEEIHQNNAKTESRSIDLYKEKALQMYEMVKTLKDEKQQMEKTIFEMKRNSLNQFAASKSASAAAGSVEPSQNSKELEELSKKLERTTRALEAEKTKVKTLSERVTFAEKEAQGATPLIEDLEQKLENALKLSQQHKKETEQVKQKLVQSDAEKNKIKNDLLKAQAQIQTLMKRQAS